MIQNVKFGMIQNDTLRNQFEICGEYEGRTNVSARDWRELE